MKLPSLPPLFVLAAALLGATPLATTIRADDLPAYTDSLVNGWENYGWATLNYANTNPVHGGSGNSISVTAGAYQALYLHHAAFDPAAYTSLNFWIHGGTAGGQSLRLQLTVNGNALPSYNLPLPTANTWQQVTVPLSSLGASGQGSIDGLQIQNGTGNTLGTFYVDGITFLGAVVVVPDPIRLQVNADNALRTIDGRVFSVNTAIWDQQLGTSANLPLLGALKQRSLRFPGGSISDEYHWHKNRTVTSPGVAWAGSFPVLAKVAESIGAQGYLIANYGSGTPEEASAWVAYTNGSATSTQALGTDVRGENWKTVGYWASLRGASPLAGDDGLNFLRIAHAAPFGFLYWEIGNECYGGWEHDEHGGGTVLGGVAHDPYTYAQSFAQFRQKMLAVDPSIWLGAVATRDEDSYGIGTHPATNPRTGVSHTGWSAVVLATLKTQGTTPHFLIYHDYDQEPGQESDPVLLNDATHIAATRAAGLRAMLNDYFGTSTAAGVELTMTELNSVTFNPGKQTTNLVNGLFYAEVMSGVAGSEFNACHWWCLRNGVSGGNNSSGLYGARQFGDYGFLASGDGPVAVNTAYPTYYAAKLLTKWAAGGDTALGGMSNYAPLSVHAARRASGALCLLVVNRSPTADLTAQVELTGYVPGSTTGTVYHYGKSEDSAGTDLTTTTISNAAATFTAAFPSYSMTVIELAAPTATTAYGTWRNSRFTAAELADASISGDSADPDKDGISNLLEYAFGTEPKTASQTGGPLVATTTQGGSVYLTLSYNVSKTAADLTYLPQVSPGMQSAAWSGGSGSTQQVSVVDQGTTRRLTVRDLTPITPTTPQRFMRLQVTRP